MFLQYLPSLSQLQNFPELWLSILDFMDKFLHLYGRSWKLKQLQIHAAGMWWAPYVPTQPTWRVQQPWNYHKFSCCSYLQWRPKATTDCCCSERKEVGHQGWLTCIQGCIVLHTSMDTPDNNSMWIFSLSIHFQFMGCSLMALLSTNNCYRTSMFGAWMHSIFTNHIFKPVTTNCMQRFRD